MWQTEKPNYALLGRRQHYSIGNRQAQKDIIFTKAIDAIHHCIHISTDISIPDLVAAIYDVNTRFYGGKNHGDIPENLALDPIREALKSNSLFACTTCLSASGNKILAYLAILHDKNCLKENGDIDLAYTKQTIRSFFLDETKDALQFDDSAIRNLKLEDSCFKFGKNRFAHLILPFTSKDNINSVRNKIQTNHQSMWTRRLFTAFRDHKLAAAQQALHNGAEVNSVDKNNNTPLLRAVENNWPDLAVDLLSKSSNDIVNTVNIDGNTALRVACRWKSDISFLTTLLARSSDATVNMTSLHSDGDTAIANACSWSRDIPFLTTLLARSSDATINAVKNWGSKTVLLCLVEDSYNLPIIQHLAPRLLPRLTLANFQILSDSSSRNDRDSSKTAWKIAQEHAQKQGQKPWSGIAHAIGHTMMMHFANKHIPRWALQQIVARDKTQLVGKPQTAAAIFEKSFRHKLPRKALSLIRSYHEGLFDSPMEALAAINAFLADYLKKKGEYKEDGSQLLYSVEEVSQESLNPNGWLNRISREKKPRKPLDPPLYPTLPVGARKQLMTENLFQAFDCNDENAVQTALQNGADVNSHNAQGYTPVMLAAHCNWLDLTETLLVSSSDETVNAEAKDGNTLLLFLIGNQHKELFQALAPRLLPRLTLAHFQSKYINKTAWQIASQIPFSDNDWKNIARRIGATMLIQWTQHHIPWSSLHDKLLLQKKQLTAGAETAANTVDQLLGGYQIPVDTVLNIIRSYSENPFNDPTQAVLAINGFLGGHLKQKRAYQPDGSQLFQSVNDALLALHDHTSLLNLSVAEYATPYAQ